MEGHCSTGQSPQWAVVAREEEEDEEEEQEGGEGGYEEPWLLFEAQKGVREQNISGKTALGRRFYLKKKFFFCFALISIYITDKPQIG